MKLKYQLVGNNNYFNPIEAVLENRGIKDIERFLKPSKEDTHHYSKLINIHRAVNVLIKKIEEGGELFVQVDSDPQMDLLLVHY